MKDKTTNIAKRSAKEMHGCFEVGIGHELFDRRNPTSSI
jgi:hypothetical protein